MLRWSPVLRTLSPAFALYLTCSLAGCSLIFESASPGAETDGSPTEADAPVSVDPCSTVPPTITPFTIPELACGETEINVPAVEVQAGSEECPLQGLQWTLQYQRQDGGTTEELFTHLGALNDPVPLGSRVLGGTFEAPIFNVASYHGPTLLEIAIEPGASGTDQLYQVTNGVANDDYQLRVTVAANDQSSVTISLFPHGSPYVPNVGPADRCLGVEGAECNTTSPLTTIIKNFNTGQALSTPRLQFKMEGIDTFYFDHASLVRKSTSTQLVQDGSFQEEWATGPWLINCDNKCTQTIVPIPDFFLEYGAYTLTLTAIGTAGAESASVVHNFSHVACPAQ